MSNMGLHVLDYIFLYSERIFFFSFFIAAANLKSSDYLLIDKGNIELKYFFVFLGPYQMNLILKK